MSEKMRAQDDKIILLDNKIPVEFNKVGSIFHNITVACLRWKQLNNGAHPRIVANLSKRKNTSIAVEEVKQNLITFTIMTEDNLS